MIRSLIIDDEENNIVNLSGLLQQCCKEVLIVGTATNADDAIKLITEIEPELIFLDIQLPEKNGFELLSSLSSYNFEIIFVTAYDKYAIRAIKFAAIDYLLKPISAEELKIAVKRAIEKCLERKKNLQLENLIQLMQQAQFKNEHKIALSSLRETRFVRTIDIIRCESSNSYTSFFLVTKEKIIVSKPIVEYEDMLADYDFIRCHQCHLVNKKYIVSWTKTDGDYLLLEDKTLVPVARLRKEFIKNELIKDNKR
jgi:two-component system LytT family response regulator